MGEETKTCYSTDEEFFNCEDLQTLFTQMSDEGNFIEGATYFQAEFSTLKNDQVCNEDAVKRFLENLDERAYDIHFNDEASPYSNLSGEKLSELNALIVGWLDKNVEISKHWVVNPGSSRECRVTAEDLIQYSATSELTGAEVTEKHGLT